jgi:peptidoglycan/LPS O-acetylase OafA/YrhL
MAAHTIPHGREARGQFKAHRPGFAFQSSLARSSQYRADVDGLRALAILAVVFYHAKLFRCTGGYIGVDIFFVISGYLITSLILRDLDNGTFSFAAFYERRIRRIFPALFTLLFFSAVVAFVLLVPPDLETFGKSLAATTFFVSNIQFWRTAQPLGYFSHNSAAEALLHTWSLSVEEQFYLIFPAILLFLFRRARKLLIAGLVLLTCASFCISLWALHRNPVAGFYLFVPRAWELLIGALLATKLLRPLRSRIVRETVSVIGLGLIVFAVFFFSEATPFPGVYATLPCLGTWLLIYAGEDGASTTKTILSLRPVVFIGIISYSLYLWHWPLLVFSRYFVAGDLTDVETALVLVASAIAAFISFEFIERPFRGSRSTVTRYQIFSLGLVVSLAALAIATTAYFTRGLPGRYAEPTRRLIAENLSRRDDYDQSCGNWRTNVQSLADIRFCSLGDQDSKKIMFWGDSHVEQLIPAVRDLYGAGDLKGRGAVFAIANGCLPSVQLNAPGGYHCDAFAKLALTRAEESDIGTVFIGSNTWWYSHDDTSCASEMGRCTRMLSPAEIEGEFLPELAEHIVALRRLGKRVIVSLPFPMYDKSIPDLEMHNAIFGDYGLGGEPVDFTSPLLREAIRSMAVGSGAEVFDPRTSLCPDGHCITEANGVSIYIDSHHLAASSVGLLEPNLQGVLQ